METILVLFLILYALLWFISFMDMTELIEKTEFKEGSHVPKYTKIQIATNFFVPFYIRLTELYTKFNNLK